MKQRIVTYVIISLLVNNFTYAQEDQKAVDLGLSVKWAVHNIGATFASEYGTYFAWGELEGKSNYWFDTYKYSDPTECEQCTIDLGSSICGTQYDVARQQWKGEWRLPTDKEILELRNKCRWKWTSLDGVTGFMVTGPNGNKIFFPAGGEISGEKNNTIGKECSYWSGTKSFIRNAFTLHAYIYEDEIRVVCWGTTKPVGRLVRPVMDNPDYRPTIALDTTNPQMMEWQAPQYESVLQGILEENYSDVFNSLTILAASGDAKAQCALATMYCLPAGTTRDYASAYNLLKDAALQNYERAEYLLGAFGSLNRSRQGEIAKLLGIDDFTIMDDHFWKQCFKNTENAIDSYKDAFEWFYMRDGNWGYRDIMYYAALVFLDKDSELYNEEKGLKWLKRSAELDYIDATRLLEKINKKE